jgi:hypothetical protein
MGVRLELSWPTNPEPRDLNRRALQKGGLPRRSPEKAPSEAGARTEEGGPRGRPARRSCPPSIPRQSRSPGRRSPHGRSRVRRSRCSFKYRCELRANRGADPSPPTDPCRSPVVPLRHQVPRTRRSLATPDRRPAEPSSGSRAESPTIEPPEGPSRSAPTESPTRARIPSDRPGSLPDALLLTAWDPGERTTTSTRPGRPPPAGRTKAAPPPPVRTGPMHESRPPAVSPTARALRTTGPHPSVAPARLTTVQEAAARLPTALGDPLTTVPEASARLPAVLLDHPTTVRPGPVRLPTVAPARLPTGRPVRPPAVRREPPMRVRLRGRSSTPSALGTPGWRRRRASRSGG